MILPSIETPADLKGLDGGELAELCEEIRTFIVDTVTTTGGHLGSNLGAVELTLALHRVFDSPRDVILWDTGHQAYVHKLVTGRRYGFKSLKQAGGMSGYPNRAESEHDWIENSHASTALSYAHGIASGFELRGIDGERKVVAVVGDGALTGGMAYEALNNLGHSQRRVVIVLNDNGRSYAPTVSQLSQSLTTLRLNPTYTAARERLRMRLRELPAFGELAYSGVHSVTSALRDMVAPHTFFEALGVRYAGPIDGHDIDHMEQAFTHAAAWDGPIVVHVLTQKGRGYAPAEEDDIQRLHDVKATKTVALENTVGNSAGRGVGGSATSDGGGIASPDSIPDGEVEPSPQRASTYTDAFTRALLAAAEEDPRIVALTAAMPGPTGLLAFQARFPDRFFDVGIAEQHGATAAAGMAMAGLRPVVAVYSTFWSRSFDQANLDVGLHGCPVVFVLDRAGITGDDGPSHHGILDLALALSIPGMTVFAPSSAEEVEPMLRTALELPGPSTLRVPKTAPWHVDPRRSAAAWRRAGLAPATGRSACSAWAKWSGPASPRPTSWPQRGSRPRCGTRGWCRRLTLPCWRTQHATAWWSRRRTASATVAPAPSCSTPWRHTWSRPACPPPPPVSSASPGSTWPRARPTTSSASLGLDGAGIAETIRRARIAVPAEPRPD